MVSKNITTTHANLDSAPAQVAKCSTLTKNPIVDLLKVKHGHEETEEEHDARYVAYLSRPDIDGWEVRKALQSLHSDDLIPEPAIIIAALKACRKVNDIALCIRLLEAIKFKAGRHTEVYPYIIQEIRPTLEELGIPTPEELGWDKPELAFSEDD